MTRRPLHKPPNRASLEIRLQHAANVNAKTYFHIGNKCYNGPIPKTQTVALLLANLWTFMFHELHAHPKVSFGNYHAEHH